MQKVMQRVESTFLVVLFLFLPYYYCFKKGFGRLNEFLDFLFFDYFSTESKLVVTGCAFFLIMLYCVWRGAFPQLRGKKWIALCWVPIVAGIAGLILSYYMQRNILQISTNLSPYVQVLRSLEVCLAFTLPGTLLPVFFVKTRPYAAVLFGFFSIGLSEVSYSMVQAMMGFAIDVDTTFIDDIMRISYECAVGAMAVCFVFGLLLCVGRYLLKRFRLPKAGQHPVPNENG